jgi:hypothetical protein
VKITFEITDDLPASMGVRVVVSEHKGQTTILLNAKHATDALCEALTTAFQEWTDRSWLYVGDVARDIERTPADSASAPAVENLPQSGKPLHAVCCECGTSRRTGFDLWSSDYRPPGYDWNDGTCNLKCQGCHTITKHALVKEVSDGGQR